jgi:hypothetical protein
MSAERDQQMDSVITGFELTLTNLSAEPEIAALMQARGFPKGRVDEGLALVRAARGCQQERQAELGNQLQATAAFKDAFAAASSAYADFRETARAHFKNASANPSAWQKLGLAGKAPQDTLGFINTAYATFDNALANPEIVAALMPYGYTGEKITQARAAVAAAADANQAQERAKGAARGTTTGQDQAYEQAKAWMNTFKRIARRALQGRPDLLTKLGM